MLFSARNRSISSRLITVFQFKSSNMDREQQYYHQQFQTSLGCTGMLFFLLASLAGMWLSGVTSLPAWFIVPILLSVVGLLLGLLITRLLATPHSLQESKDKTNSQTRQLVGEQCVCCQNRITNVLEGDFCTSCGSALHHRCKKSRLDTAELHCPDCGACFSR